MKRWAIGSITFTLSLGIGIWMAWLFLFNDPQYPAKETRITHLAPNSVNGLSTQYPNLSFPFVPEFTDLEVDLSSAKAESRMEISFEGRVNLCSSDPSKEQRKWLGLFKRKNQYILERRIVTYGSITSTDFESYATMNFKDSGSAVFLLSDQGTIKPGPVKTLFIEPRYSEENNPYPYKLVIGFRSDFKLGSRTSVVRVAPVILKGGHPASALIIEHDQQSQVIWYAPYLDADGFIGELDWVGDMDNDGRLDMKFSYYRQNGGQLESILFLSSFANEGKLLGIAASYSARCTEIAPDKIK